MVNLSQQKATSELVSSRVLEQLGRGEAPVQKDGAVESWHFGDERFNNATAKHLVNLLPAMQMMNRTALLKQGVLNIIDAGGAMGEMSRYINVQLQGHHPIVSCQFHVVDIDRDKIRAGREMNGNALFHEGDILTMQLSDIVDSLGRPLDPTAPVYWMHRAVDHYFPDGQGENKVAINGDLSPNQLKMFRHLLEILPRGSMFVDILSTGDRTGRRFFEDVLHIVTGFEKTMHYIDRPDIIENLPLIAQGNSESKRFYRQYEFDIEGDFGTREIFGHGSIYDRYRDVWTSYYERLGGASTSDNAIEQQVITARQRGEESETALRMALTTRFMELARREDFNFDSSTTVKPRVSVGNGTLINATFDIKYSGIALQVV